MTDAADASTATPSSGGATVGTPTSGQGGGGAVSIFGSSTSSTLSSLSNLPEDATKAVETLLHLVEMPGTSPSQLVPYLGEILSVVGFVVGVFNTHIGLDLTTVPKAVLLGGSIVLMLGMSVVRLVLKHTDKALVAQTAVSLHAIAAQAK